MDSHSPCSPAGHRQVLIAGGGAGGVTIASWLRRLDPDLEIAIIEPSAFHDYQSGWVLVAGGFMPASATRRSERSVIPAGVELIHSKVVRFDPDQQALHLIGGAVLTYDVLIVALGIEINWTAIEGLTQSLGHDGVTSIYSRRTASYTRQCFEEFKGGTAIFTHPATAIKCGGAPQKIMHLAHQQFARRSGVGVSSSLIFCTAQSSLFPVKAYSDTMAEIAERHHCQVRYRSELVAVDGAERTATFQVSLPNGEQKRETLAFDLLHVVPPMAAPEVVATSPLARSPAEGWVEVDPATGQHPRYANVFAIGDVGSFPTAKTAAAVRKQAPVIAANVLAVLQGNPPAQNYAGYSACPLITSDHSVMLIEFDYSKQPVSSFLVNPVKERWSLWLLERFGFPWIYWNRMLKGHPHEGSLLRPLAPLARALGLQRWKTVPAGGAAGNDRHEP
jgi:sulfide:quinone oxidoreductase